jgi:FkbM family methyltransferase
MNRCRLPGGLEIHCLSAAEAALLYQDLFRDHSYFQHGIEIRPTATVFDVGANIGLFALYIHQRCPDVELFAFEPLPPVFEVLAANVKLHGVSARLFQCGLSVRQGSAVFGYYPHNSALSGQYFNPEEEERLARTILSNKRPELGPVMDVLLRGKFEVQQFTCHVSTVSEIIARYGVPCVDLLKIDVEKAEADVLAGVADEHWPRIRQVVVEVHDVNGRLSDIIALLRQKRFRTVSTQTVAFHGTALYDIFALR